MKTFRYFDSQILNILRQAENAFPCRSFAARGAFYYLLELILSLSAGDSVGGRSA
jgi:hypothetical protein